MTAEHWAYVAAAFAFLSNLGAWWIERSFHALREHYRAEERHHAEWMANTQALVDEMRAHKRAAAQRWRS